MKKEAKYWETLDGGVVHCLLCPKDCKLKAGQVGFCGVRQHLEGRLYTHIYGEVTSAHLDPIEKKPLYHYFPGRQILSLGTKGCNMRCDFCQNWSISQRPDAGSEMVAPEEAVRMALESKSFGISYTYSEPLIWFEYVLDTSTAARRHGLKNVLVTNGFIREEPLEELLPVVDAANIDVKSFDRSFYTRICKGQLEPVLRTCERVRPHWHVEITNLVVPFKEEAEILKDTETLVEWVAERLGPDTPLHFSRYFPMHKMDLPSTPVAVLEKCLDVGRRKLKFVYLGNVASRAGSDTLCPSCGTVLIERVGYFTAIRALKDGSCAKCGAAANVVTG